MVWLWIAVTLWLIGLFVFQLAHDHPPATCQGPGPHRGALFVVPVTPNRLSLLCESCRSRRNENHRLYFWMPDRLHTMN